MPPPQKKTTFGPAQFGMEYRSSYITRRYLYFCGHEHWLCLLGELSCRWGSSRFYAGMAENYELSAAHAHTRASRSISLPIYLLYPHLHLHLLHHTPHHHHTPLQRHSHPPQRPSPPWSS